MVDEKHSENHDSANDLVFFSFLFPRNSSPSSLFPEQRGDTAEISLLASVVPVNQALSEFNQNKVRLTCYFLHVLMLCSHKTKSFGTGKCHCPSAFKGVLPLPITHQASEWMVKKFFSD